MKPPYMVSPGPSGSWDLQIAEGRLSWSPEVFKLFGVDEECFEVSNEACLNLVHPDDRGAFLVEQTAALTGVRPMDHAFRVVRKDGVRYVRGRAHLIRDQHTGASRLSGTVEDVTDALSASPDGVMNEALFRASFNQSHSFQGIVATDGTLLEVNCTALLATGYALPEVIARKVWEVPWWAYDAAITSHMRSLFERALGGQVVEASTNYRVASGDVRVTDFAMTPILSAAGDVEYVLVSGIDATSQKRQSTLRASQARLIERVAKGDPLQSVLDDTVSLVELQDSSLKCSILLVSDDGRCLLHKASHRLAPEFTSGIDGIEIGPDLGSCGTAAYTKMTVLVVDIAADPRWQKWRDLALQHGYRACWSAPIFNGDGTVVGTIAVYADEPRLPTDGEMELINTAVQVAQIALGQDKTSRALVNNEKLIRQVVQAAATGISFLDPQGNFQMCNPAFCKSVGYSEQELLGLNVRQLTHPDDLANDDSQMQALLLGGADSKVTKKRYIRKDGATTWVRSSLAALRHEDGSVRALVTVSEDVTQERHMLEALEQAQGLIRTASQVAHLGGWSINLSAMTVELSEEARVIHELEDRHIDSFEEAISAYIPSSQIRLRAVFKACIDSGQPFDEELELLTGTGRQIWIRVVGEALRDSSGAIVKVVGAVMNIHETKVARLKETELLSRLERIASRLPGMIYEFRLNPDGRLSLPYCSDAVFELSGFRSEELKEDATPVFSMIHADDIGPMQASIAKSAQDLSPWYHEFRQLDQDGKTIWFRGNSIPTREPDGSVLWHGFINNITTERAAQESLMLLDTAVSRLSDIVLITEAEPFDEPGPKIVFANDAFTRRTGYSREEAIGNSPRMLQGPKTQRAELNKIRRALEKWEPVRAELINYTKSGEEFWLELDIVPLANESGRYTHWVAVERDITERKNAELELARLNRTVGLRSSLSAIIIQANDEGELLQRACDLATTMGGYAGAWVSIPRHDEDKTLVAVASSGVPQEYLDSLKLSWSGQNEKGLGPSGIAVRTGKPVVTADVADETVVVVCRDLALKAGVRGLIHLPLRHRDKVIGLFTLHLSEVRTSSESEVALLQSLADDLCQGIEALRAQQERQRVLAAVSMMAASVSATTGTEFLEQLVRSMAEALNASAAFVTELGTDEPVVARIVCGVLDGKAVEPFTFAVQGTPCEIHLVGDDRTIASEVALKYPKFGLLSQMGAQSYIGRMLLRSDGKRLGHIFVLYREPLTDTEFASSTLKIFASRAAAELERQAADSRIRQQASLLDKAQDAILVQTPDNRVLYWNKSAERLYGWTEQQARDSSLLELLYDEPSAYLRAINTVLNEGDWHGELEQRNKSGETLIIEGRWNLVPDSGVGDRTILAINTDITERKAAQAEIQKLAFYDSLTGLPNRQLLNDRLKQAIASAGRNTKSAGVLFIDLDNFKVLNDIMGHATGDLLLKEVAKRLCECMREGDTVARLGGDEFVVLLNDLACDHGTAVTQTSRVAEKIIHLFAEPYSLAGHIHNSTASIGGTLVDHQSTSLDEILKQADVAMYQAKAVGRNAFRFFEASMNTGMLMKVALETDLRQSLLNDDFLLHYQPQIDHLGHVFGAEALVRWLHPQRGMVSPAQFIPVAEESRLIVQLGRAVLHKACTQLVLWSRTELTQNLVLSVNVSVVQFRQSDFFDEVLRAVTATGANPTRLKLEITESLLVDNVEDVIAKMMLLKDKGIGFSLDDFGTGYSSLSYLKRLPLDQLKIDQSFVKDVLVDVNDASIARTIVALGNSLGLSVVAEGVETEGQRVFLRENGCMLYQGYLFSRPVDAAALVQYLGTLSPEVED